jgi:hypothetical protein
MLKEFKAFAKRGSGMVLAVAVVLVCSLILSGCCSGSWCVGAGGGKKVGVPPDQNVDDRTGGIDPRTTGAENPK